MRFSARVSSRRRCRRHGCTPKEETRTISQLDFGCGARRICAVCQRVGCSRRRARRRLSSCNPAELFFRLAACARNRMNVHFFRHGAAISNDPRLTEAEIAEERFLDAPLSDHGREQARLAGKELAHALHAATVDVVLVSPLCRALETAELILSSAGISPRRQCE